MLPEGGDCWQKWLAQHGERVRLLYALQEQALSSQSWSVFQQLAQEREQLLQELSLFPLTEITPEVRLFLREIEQLNLRLQQAIEEQWSRTRAEAAALSQMRQQIGSYRTDAVQGGIEDRTV